MRVGKAGVVLQHEELELEELAEEAHLGRLARLLLGPSEVDGLACQDRMGGQREHTSGWQER